MNEQHEAAPRPRAILEEFFTAEELMEKFQISKRTLSRWVQQDIIPAPKRVGRKFFWDAAKVRRRLMRIQESV